MFHQSLISKQGISTIIEGLWLECVNHHSYWSGLIKAYQWFPLNWLHTIVLFLRSPNSMTEENKVRIILLFLLVILQGP